MKIEHDVISKQPCHKILIGQSHQSLPITLFLRVECYHSPVLSEAPPDFEVRLRGISPVNLIVTITVIIELDNTVSLQRRT